MAVLGRHSLIIRIVDTKPTVRPPSRPSRPTCHGDPDACREVLSNKSLWEGMTKLCANYSGDISLGNGATMRCP